MAVQEAIPGVRFHVLEKGGTRVKQIVQKSNPTATPGCLDDDCIACKDGSADGGLCRQGNIGYQMGCDMCDQTDNQTERTTYIGETSRNIYSRGKEHMYNFASVNNMNVNHHTSLLRSLVDTGTA